jgi:outer membrane protein OmpA-like peptidoglycan-associated protein/opacity protein-like surface antigen
MKKTLLTTLFFALFFAQFVQAQETAKPLEIGVALGTMGYQGDVNENLLAKTNEMNAAGGIFIRKYFNNNFAVRGSLMAGKITGTDLNFSDIPWRKQRAYSFTSPVTEVMGQLEWHLLGNQKTDKNKGFLPYLFGGIGVISTNPKATFNPTWDTKVTSVANLNADKTDGAGQKTRFGVNAGGGVNFPFGTNWSVGAELSMRSAFTDYFDGISKTANPDKQDWYLFGALNLAYRFSKAVDEDTDGDGVPNSRDACPNVRGTKANGGCPVAEKVAVTTVEEPKMPAKPVEVPPVAEKVEPVKEPTPAPVEVVKVAVPEPVKATPPPVEVVKTEPVVVVTQPTEVVTTTTTSTGVVIEKSEEEAMSYALQGVQFETGKSVLLSQSYKSLNDILAILKKYPSYKLQIEGNTDNQGNESANQQLSQRRAEACKAYLVSKGISASRMRASGLGSSQPIAPNTTVEGRKQNRRVEFRLVTE